MFKAIKDNKIISINDKDYFPLMNIDYSEEDVEHTIDDYAEYNGEYLLKSEIPAPSKEEQAEKRKQAYILEKDPITCQIQSLKDEEQTPEILEEIEALKQERAEIVQDIKNRFPYPEEED